MTDITIPPAALDAGYAAWWKSIKSGAMNERALRAAFLAMIENWPGMWVEQLYPLPVDTQGVILPLPQENTDAEA